MNFDPANFDFEGGLTATEEIDGEEAPKRRGRPPGSKNASSMEAQSLEGDSEPAKKRGRKSNNSISVNGLETILMSSHQILSGFLDNPAIEIESKEAKLLATALTEFANQHKIKVNPKTASVYALLYAAGVVYGPRAFMLYMQMKAKKDATAAPAV